jgi:hypothetical protein
LRSCVEESSVLLRARLVVEALRLDDEERFARVRARGVSPSVTDFSA